MTITPEELAQIKQAAEQVRKAQIAVLSASRNPSPSIYVQQDALRAADTHLRRLMNVDNVLAMVAEIETLRQQLADEQDTSGTLGRVCYELGEQVEAGAADSRRLDALTQGIESGHVAFEDDPCVFCEVDEDECDGDSNDCRKNLYGKDFFRVWKTVDQASKSGVLIETTDPRAVADAILAAKEGKT